MRSERVFDLKNPQESEKTGNGREEESMISRLGRRAFTNLCLGAADRTAIQACRVATRFELEVILFLLVWCSTA